MVYHKAQYWDRCCLLSSALLKYQLLLSTSSVIIIILILIIIGRAEQLVSQRRMLGCGDVPVRSVLALVCLHEEITGARRELYLLENQMPWGKLLRTGKTHTPAGRTHTPTGRR
ncbi:hypothetical protein F2P79_022509 [Pimephales promelas]|nr:hypothetical protein F2P79_022509 [Pimephales promelas]